MNRHPLEDPLEHLPAALRIGPKPAPPSRPRPSRVVLTLLAHLAFFASAAAWSQAPSPAQAQPIHLSFGWPTPVTAKVTFTKSRARSADGKTQNNALTTLYTMHMAAPNAQGERVVSYSDIRVDPATAPQGTAAQGLKLIELMAQIGMPPLVIDAKGHFARVQNLDDYRAKYRSLFNDLLGPKAQDERMQRALDQATSPQMLLATAQNEWDQLIGTWVDGKLELGQWYEHQGESMLPVLPNAKVRMTMQFRIARVLDCKRGGVVRRCVELERVTRPNPQDVSAAIEAFARQAVGGDSAQRERIEAIKIDQVLRLITEPQGLIPHQLLVTKDIGITSRRGDTLKVGTELQEESVSFAY